jgi:hypothetical protein
MSHRGAEPIIGSDVRLRHISCGARDAPSLTRIISTLGAKTV